MSNLLLYPDQQDDEALPSILCDLCSKLMALRISSERTDRRDKFKYETDDQLWEHVSPYFEFPAEAERETSGGWWHEKSVCHLCRWLFMETCRGNSVSIEWLRWRMEAYSRIEVCGAQVSLFLTYGSLGSDSISSVLFGISGIEESTYARFMSSGGSASLTAMVKSRSRLASMGSVRKWLTDCNEKHNCLSSNHNTRKGWNPTRLLDTQNPLDFQAVPVCLGSQLPPNTQYITLSHCWGTHIPDRLDITTEKSLFQGQNLHQFCQLFQDVIQFVRSLGVRYLWIDSLCILQGEGGDWSSEASKMSKVYKFSSLNIAASASSSGDEPLFKLNTEFSPIGVAMHIANEAVDFHYMRPSHEDAKMFDVQPLHCRAWVVQELYLSPRVLFFTSDQLYWLCQKSTTAENDIERVGNTLRDIQSAYGTGSHSHQNLTAWNASWEALVIRFMRTNLTFPTDRLVSFSGIAMEFYATRPLEPSNLLLENQITGGRRGYFAGLWSCRMPEDLMWSVVHCNAKRSKSTYIAPTWSWASLDPTDIYWHFRTPDSPKAKDALYDFEYEVQIEPVVQELDFGELSGGRIRMRVPMCRGSYGRRPMAHKVRYFTQPGVSEETGNLRDTANSQAKSNSVEPQTPAGHVKKPIFWLTSGPIIHFAYRDESAIQNEEQRHDLVFVLLPIHREGNQWCGLVLAPTPSDPSTYTRFGSWLASAETWGLKIDEWRRYFEWGDITII